MLVSTAGIVPGENLVWFGFPGRWEVAFPRLYGKAYQCQCFLGMFIFNIKEVSTHLTSLMEALLLQGNRKISLQRKGVRWVGAYFYLLFLPLWGPERVRNWDENSILIIGR